MRNTFSGEGSAQYPGRWNSLGKECVYAASSESLAILEVLVHVESQDEIGEYCFFELRIPVEDLLYLKEDQLPSNWQCSPSPRKTAEIGDNWLESGKTLALAVPSAVVPREWIYVLNPQHPGFGLMVEEAKQWETGFDSRLVEGAG